MNDAVERSGSGSPILRPEPIQREFKPAAAHEGSVEVGAKLNELFGEVTNVFRSSAVRKRGFGILVSR